MIISVQSMLEVTSYAAERCAALSAIVQANCEGLVAPPSHWTYSWYDLNLPQNAINAFGS
jgi:hypothetical protein